MTLKTTMPLQPTTLSEDLEDIHPRKPHVWNFDEIGFDLNISWINVVCTYSFSLYIGCEGHRSEREHTYGAQLSYSTELVTNSSCHM